MLTNVLDRFSIPATLDSADLVRTKQEYVILDSDSDAVRKQEKQRSATRIPQVGCLLACDIVVLFSNADDPDRKREAPSVTTARSHVHRDHG